MSDNQAREDEEVIGRLRGSGVGVGGSAEGRGTEEAAPSIGESDMVTAFDEAEELSEDILDDKLEGDALDTAVRRSLALWRHCTVRVLDERLVSSNETLEEVSTTSLRLILAPFYLGQVAQRQRGGPEDRASFVKEATWALDTFLQTAEQLKLVSSYDRRRLDESIAQVEAQNASSNDGRGSAAEPQPFRRPMPGANYDDSRQAKIARFKEDREERKRLTEISRLERQISRAAGGGGDVEALADGVGGAGSSTGVLGAVLDEETRRERNLLRLRVSTRQAVDDLIALHEESQLLRFMYSQRQEHDDPKGYSPRAEAAAAAGDSRMRQRPATSATAPDRPGLDVVRIGPSWEMERQTVRAEVFQDRVPPPTMSLEELGRRERADAEARAAQQAEAERDRPVHYRTLEEQGREDDEEAVDAATLRDRAWDDWKDSIVKGYGNTKRY